ncbi:hypothetical protein SNE40_017563 [Patella caerulea]|uniref:Uncharacterized protein n=1 Tax=Patella caerulea TaxID=87958 RepID=A0AAN8JCG8_PATCE
MQERKNDSTSINVVAVMANNTNSSSTSLNVTSFPSANSSHTSLDVTLSTFPGISQGQNEAKFINDKFPLAVIIGISVFCGLLVAMAVIYLVKRSRKESYVNRPLTLAYKSGRDDLIQVVQVIHGPVDTADEQNNNPKVSQTSQTFSNKSPEIKVQAHNDVTYYNTAHEVRNNDVTYYNTEREIRSDRHQPRRLHFSFNAAQKDYNEKNLLNTIENGDGANNYYTTYNIVPPNLEEAQRLSAELKLKRASRLKESETPSEDRNYVVGERVDSVRSQNYYSEPMELYMDYENEDEHVYESVA